MQNKFTQYQPLVIQWAEERGIFADAKPRKQLLKTYEEIGELIEAIEDANLAEIKDAIGDIIVTLLIYSKMENLGIETYYKKAYPDNNAMGVDLSVKKLVKQWSNLFYGNQERIAKIFDNLNDIAYLHRLEIWDCLESAYNEIRDRKGKMINGTFVKD